jgi:hypothetical protein
MINTYMLAVTLNTESVLSIAELQHLGFRAADEVLDTIIEDGRFVLSGAIEFEYHELLRLARPAPPMSEQPTTKEGD